MGILKRFELCPCVNLLVCEFIIPVILSELSKKPVEGFSAGLVDDEDLYKWEILIIGPQDTY